jgi:hypothetical protein
MDKTGCLPLDCVETVSGVHLSIRDPDPADINIGDIAYSLAGTFRFNAHTRYSVAQHSVIVSMMVLYPLAGLLHDGDEAYTGDMIKPLKVMPWAKGFCKTAARIQAAVWKRFGVDYTSNVHASVKYADTSAVYWESRQYMKRWREWNWGDFVAQPLPDNVVLEEPWSALKAEHRFLERYKEICGDEKPA